MSQFSSTRLRLLKIFSEELPPRTCSKPCKCCLQVKHLEEQALALAEKLLPARAVSASSFNESHDPFDRKLPVEISSEILQVCLEPFADFSDVFGTDIGKAFQRRWPLQFVLGAVCRKWRQIVRSNPACWNTIVLDVREGYPVARTVMVREWLERSGGLPLNIAFRAGKGSITEALEVASVLKPYFSRCISAHLDLPNDVVKHLWSEASIPTQIRTLALLRSRRIRGRPLPAPPDDCSLDLQSARPQHLSLMGYLPANVAVEWSKVTQFAGRLFQSDAIFILRSAPQLTNFKLDVIDQEGSPSVIYTAEPSPLPSLQKLEISGWTGDKVISSIHCPSLQRLVWHLDSSVGLLASLSLETNLTLTTLDMQWFEMDSEQLINVLNTTLSLTSLKLELDEFDAAFFDHFLSTASNTLNNEPTFLPKLSSLDISSPLTFPWSFIYGVVSTAGGDHAIRSQRPLQFIHFNLDDVDIDNSISQEDKTRLLDILNQRQDIDVVLESHAEDEPDLIQRWARHPSR